MTEREYPRWVHADGRPSTVVHTEDEERDLLERWAAEDAAKMEGVPQFTAADIERAYADGFEAGRIAEANPSDDIPQITEDTQFMTHEIVPDSKRRGGWPKGKPRNTKEAAVN